MGKSYSSEMALHPLLFFLLLLCSLTPCFCRNSTSSDCDINEREALLTLKRYLLILNEGYYAFANGPQSWKGNRCCQWEGISCDERGHITKLQIPAPASRDQYVWLNTTGAKFFGTLLNLRYLIHLDLTGSFCDYCTIPQSIGSMQQLQFLGLPQYTYGEIPSYLGNLTGLQVLIFPNSYSLVVKDNGWLSRLTSLTRLEMTGAKFLRPADLAKVLPLLPSLIALELSFARLDNAFLHGYFSNTTLSANVRELDLSFNNFSGAIPKGLQNFTSLEYLDLSANYFDSSFPMWFGSMRNLATLSLNHNSLESIEGGSGWLQKLKRLELQDNNLSGDIPGWLGELSQLQVLDLSRNKFSGSVPSSFGRLLFLRTLDLRSNLLNGSIPDGLGQLSNLKSLDIAQNSLNGLISEAHFWNLSKLSYLDLNDNRLNIELDLSWMPSFQLRTIRMRSCRLGKQFPRWVRMQKELHELDLSNASISNELPEWIGETKISFLNLSYNSISGPLPFWPDDLESIDVSHNSISGSLPDIVGSMSKMETLYASDNDIGGSIPSSFCNMKSLHWLDLSKNKLRGSIPDCWDAPLEHMDFSVNDLLGSIPSSICRLKGLSSLHLNNNRLSGELPSALSNCSQLVILDLGENDLEGAIPTWMAGGFSGNLPFLQFLRLRKNKLYGEIPTQLCTFTVLQVLDLADNRLTGPIPRCLGFMTGFNLNQNDVNQIESTAPSPLPDPMAPSPLSDPMAPSPAVIAKGSTDWGREHMTEVMKGRDNVYTKIGLQLVTNLDLSRNKLVGNIPGELAHLFGLHGLNFSHNHLDGDIPRRIGHMRSLESLDLSDNHLSGNIPRSISALTSLSQLNLSHNNLTGEIPKGSQIQTLEDPSNFADNPLLCADFQPRKCRTSTITQPPLPAHQGGEDNRDDKLEKLIFYAVATLGFACGFWGVIGSMVLNKGWRLSYFGFADRAIDGAYVTLALMAAGWKRLLAG